MMMAPRKEKLDRSRLRDEAGQAMIEYALILALVALFCFGTLTLFGAPMNAIFNAVVAGF
jgi:Flp pilus assembly pilin Flp